MKTTSIKEKLHQYIETDEEKKTEGYLYSGRGRYCCL